MLILLASIAAAACPAPTTTIDVQRQVDTALLTFVQLDDEGFEIQRRGAIDAIICLHEVIHPPHAASFLRMEGIAAFASGNQDFSIRAFHSALSVQPEYQLKAALAPPGGPLANLYQTALQAPPATWTLPPGGGIRFVNGIQSEVVPTGLAIVQLAEPSGQVRWTGIVTRPEELPPTFPTMVAMAAPMPVLPAPVPAPLPEPMPIAPAPLQDLDAPEPKRSSGGSNGAKTGTLIVAGVLGAAAAGLYGGSILSRTRYNAAPTAKRRAATNTLWYAGIGAAGVAVTVGVVGIALPSMKKARPASPTPTDAELY